MLLASFLVRFDAEHGLAAQRINVRWAPGLAAGERTRLEQQAALVPVERRGPDTWSYRLTDRSRRNIERLIRDPRVADTAHVDRTAFRVRLDRPDLHPWVIRFLEREQAATAWYLLAAVAGLVAVGARRSIADALVGIFTLTRTLGHAAIERTTRPLPRPAWWEYAAGLGFTLFLLARLLRTGPDEEEIVQATILPNQIFYRALFDGQWLYWLNDLGFGSPMPLGDPLLFHPVFAPLAAMASLRTTLSAVWVAQTIVMVVYFLRLAAVSGIVTPAVRLVVFGCYVTSPTFVLYFLDSDWVQMAITWTLYPAIVFHLRSAIAGGARGHFWRTACWLAFLFGFWILNAHPGYIIPLALVLAVYVVTAARLDRQVYLCLFAGAVLCTGMAAARIYALLYEMRLFPAGSGAIREGTVPAAYLGAVAAPLFEPAYRGPFIGAVFAVAILAGLVRFSRLHDPHLRGCVVACVAAAAFNVLSPDLTSRVLPAMSTWLFRDPMLFFGVLAGGTLLQSASFGRFRTGATLLLALQVVQQYVVMAPEIRTARGRNPDLLFYRHQGQAVGLGRVLVDRAAQFGPRLYLSPEVDRAMRGRLSADGIHFSSDLILLGLNPVNGWFKNVSMAAFHPPDSLMESFIHGDVNVIQNDHLLNVLGINLILSTEPETGIPAGLRVTDRPRLKDRTRLPGLVLLANPNAWPRAALLEPEASSIRLPVREGCINRGALCLEYEPLARLRLAGDVALRASNGQYLARIPSADHDRLLFISAAHRPEWTAMAADGRTLSVHPVATAFLGITIPAGVTDITVTYAPHVLVALTWGSSLLFFGVGGAALLLWSQTRRSSRSSAA